MTVTEKQRAKIHRNNIMQSKYDACEYCREFQLQPIATIVRSENSQRDMLYQCKNCKMLVVGGIEAYHSANGL